jgi:primosomal protein N''
MLYRPFYWPFNKIKIKNMKKVLYSLLAVTFAGSMLAAVVFAEESSSNTPMQRPMKTADERSASLTQNTEGKKEYEQKKMAMTKEMGTVEPMRKEKRALGTIHPYFPSLVSKGLGWAGSSSITC